MIIKIKVIDGKLKTDKEIKNDELIIEWIKKISEEILHNTRLRYTRRDDTYSTPISFPSNYGIMFHGEFPNDNQTENS